MEMLPSVQVIYFLIVSGGILSLNLYIVHYRLGHASRIMGDKFSLNYME